MFQTVMSYLDDANLILSVLMLAVITFYLRSLRPQNLPPAPGTALPFIGHLYMLERNPRGQFKQWAEKYADVFLLQMGPQRTVFINSLKTIKEALVTQADHFSDRPNTSFLAKHLIYYSKGIIFNSGANWKCQRSTTLNILRKFGMGKNILAEKILVEVAFFCKELARLDGKPSDIRELTNMSISNVISSIIFGKRFEFDDPQFIAQMNSLNDIAKLNSGTLILNFFPFLFYIPVDLFKGKKLLKAYLDQRDFLSSLIHSILNLSDSNTVDSYISEYKKEMKKEQELNQPSHLDDENLSRNISNLFGAGTETTSSTILWFMLYMLNFPEVQNKTYNEIVAQIGKERAPSIADKPRLKYFTAVIMEVQRKASILPITIPYFCSTDTTLAGYTIPKNTVVMPNLDAVLRSKEIWGDPENFRPERFLDEQGNVVKREELIPFSVGRRVCLGESLAKMELFLYLSNLIQTFQFLPARPDKIPPLKDTWGLAATPEPFEIKCVKRNA
uniref:Cytochrome P450 n=1 Tax=Biomphalaria glabrata TaxID=6526 RepID=A0A2C9K0M7_BIOGL